MDEKINITGAHAERIQDTGPTLPRIEASEVVAGLGAEPCGEHHSVRLDPISLAHLGNELIKRLRSSGGRPALTDATERCKVPLSQEDLEALSEILTAVEGATGTKPSLAQIASVIIRTYIEELKAASREQHGGETPQNRQRDPSPSVPWPEGWNGKREACRSAQAVVQRAGSTWGRRRTG